jgi:hypothetical protein
MTDRVTLAPPDGEGGMVVPVNRTIAASAAGGLSVRALYLRRFSTGMIFEIDLLAREAGLGRNWQDLFTSGDDDALHIGFTYSGTPGLSPATAGDLDSDPAWQLNRAGGGSFRYNLAWWISLHPTAETVTFGLRWVRSGIDPPALTDLPIRAAA